MRKISFYWIAAFLLAAFVVSMGGCGGGGSNSFSRSEESPGTETPEKTLSSLLVSSDMAGVMHGNEWVDLINEFEESGSGDKMNPHSWVYCITDEEAQKLREEYAGDELRLGMLNALLFDADEISRDYAREYDVLLIYPNEDFINRTLEAAGLDSNYVMDSDKGRLELFAIAKRTVNDRTFRFTYQAFRADDAVLVGVRTSEDAELTSADNSAAAGDEDITQSAVTEDDDGGIFFNVGRWRNYYNWCASLTETANESNIEASAIEVRAAADNDLTKIADAQIANLECSYRESGYRPWGGWIIGDAANIQRKNQVSVKVYNCHSYSYGKDYYLIQTNATTSPQSFLDREAVFYWIGNGGEFGRYGYYNAVNYITGYTGLFGFEGYLCSVRSGRENSDLTTDEVGLVDYIPPNVPKEKTVTEGIEWSMGGEVGFSKSGLSLNISGGVSHSKSETWTTSDWEIIAEPFSAKNASVAWTASVTGPSGTGNWYTNTDYHNNYESIRATTASRQNLSFKSEWIWYVDKSIWSKQESKTIPMKVNIFWEEGFCYGQGEGSNAWLVSWEWTGSRRYPRFSANKTMNLTMPRHSWVEAKTFDAKKVGESNIGFDILSEGNWKVSSNVNWINFTKSEGEATGNTAYPVRFDVDENTTGKSRQATITFTAYVGDRLTETSTLYVNQAAK